MVATQIESEETPNTPPMAEAEAIQEFVNLDQIQAELIAAIQESPEFDELRPVLALMENVENPEIDDMLALNEAIAEINAIGLESNGPHYIHEVAAVPWSFKWNQIDVPPLKTGESAVEEMVFSGPSTFRNWGLTVEFKPSQTLIVRSVEGVCKVVKWAEDNGKKVRVAGFRHTWSDLYGTDGDVIMMFLPYSTLTQLPYKDPPNDWRTELSDIELVTSVAGREPPEGHTFCKVMAGTTNEQFRAWCYKRKTWCIPLNVIMVEITFGGSNATMSHGSGFSTTTLSDLVVEICYVDCHGVLQTVNDPKELRAASGCFGLLGVVVSITLQLDQMGIAEMVPVHLDLLFAIPPPKNPRPEVDALIKSRWPNIDQPKLEEARLKFIKRCKEDYYLEWFWFPGSTLCWVNSWKKRGISSQQDMGLQAYPGDGWFGKKGQEKSSSWADTLFNSSAFKKLWPWGQVWVFSLGAMCSLPKRTVKNPIKTYVSEALHFRRGIQNFRCRDTEWEIPIPAKDGERDYNLIQVAWWDGICEIFSRPDAPVRVALEMRLTGGSDVLLAPQYGNDNGTISIEVLTTIPKSEKEEKGWKSFMQQIVDKWTSYKDGEGKSLNTRPHWAKEWSGLKVHEMPIEEYLKEVAYKDAFPQFRDEFESIVQKRGSTVKVTLDRFATPTTERLIFK
ncbi:hypothetical protein JAAARDRAFT_60628 [Jaapia argillacea MUCL 33604]|uniref:FAD-binding PCMH-type domain-containing protein n=1 Tax=Jaapia argillacea MUCL 33604 TaxID=933084 RepID=A0A067PIE0_9AGAM|nr:hypothetical protein JAAARDRAFT_60628 [Jaapia argillacea MUCL 33604]